MINQLTKDGPILMGQLIKDCSPNDISKPLIMEQKLTRANLAVKKAVYKLAKAKEIQETRYKSCFYDILLNEKWTTIHDINHLRLLFPLNEDLNPRRQKYSNKRGTPDDDDTDTEKSAKKRPAHPI